MIYQYRCIQGHEYDFIRSMHENEPQYYCPDCQMPMIRVWNIPNVAVKSGRYYNHGLGKWVNGSQGVKDELKKHKDSTGQELVEVGSEYKATKQKIKHNEYKMSNSEMREIARTLSNASNSK